MGRVWRKVVKKLRRQRIRCRGKVTEAQEDDDGDEGEEDDSVISKDKDSPVNPTFFLSEEEWKARDELDETEAQRRMAEEERLLRVELEQRERIRREWEEKEQTDQAEKEEAARLEEDKQKRQARLHILLSINLLGGWTVVVKDFMEENFNQFLDFLSGDIETPPLPYLMPDEGPEGTQQDGDVCQIFAKTGACRFYERCKLRHPTPTLSQTILIPNFFSNYYLHESLRDEYDVDVVLEFENSELIKEFREFYSDVLPEFKKYGKVIQFKVCCNLEAHLRGNVYVQYDNIRSAVEAFRVFNGRFYNGKQISLKFIRVPSWRSAICWSFLRRHCARGGSCNYLHVFRNPTKEFVDADGDWKNNMIHNNLPPRWSHSTPVPLGRNNNANPVLVTPSSSNEKDVTSRTGPIAVSSTTESHKKETRSKRSKRSRSHSPHRKKKRRKKSRHSSQDRHRKKKKKKKHKSKHKKSDKQICD